MMMGESEPDVHIGLQYIHINEIWQDVTARCFERFCRATNSPVNAQARQHVPVFPARAGIGL